MFVEHAPPTAILLTDIDADRLLLLSRYVRTPLDGDHLMRLEAKVENAQLCDPEEIPADVVTMNSRFRVRFLDTGEECTYTLAFPSGVNMRQNKVSVLGTFGSALLGARTGDIIQFDSGSGPRLCRIEELLYQPEAEGIYS